MAKIGFEIYDPRLSEMVTAADWLSSGRLEINADFMADGPSRISVFHEFKSKQSTETEAKYMERIFKSFGKLLMALKVESENQIAERAAHQAVVVAKKSVPEDLYL